MTKNSQEDETSEDEEFENIKLMDIYNDLLAGATITMTFASKISADHFLRNFRVVKTRQDKVAASIGIEREKLIVNFVEPDTANSIGNYTIRLRTIPITYRIKFNILKMETSFNE